MNFQANLQGGEKGMKLQKNVLLHRRRRNMIRSNREKGMKFKKGHAQTRNIFNALTKYYFGKTKKQLCTSKN